MKRSVTPSASILSAMVLILGTQMTSHAMAATGTSMSIYINCDSLNPGETTTATWSLLSGSTVLAKVTHSCTTAD